MAERSGRAGRDPARPKTGARAPTIPPAIPAPATGNRPLGTELTSRSGDKASPVAARWGEFKQPPAIFGEFGLRYVYSSNKTSKNLYDIPGGAMVSRLTYSGMNGNAAEGFGRVEHTSGFYLKGYVGAGVLSGGQSAGRGFPAAHHALFLDRQPAERRLPGLCRDRSRLQPHPPAGSAHRRLCRLSLSRPVGDRLRLHAERRQCRHLRQSRSPTPSR